MAFVVSQCSSFMLFLRETWEASGTFTRSNGCLHITFPSQSSISCSRGQKRISICFRSEGWILFPLSFWMADINCSSQEVVVQGQDKVFKDVIEPLESVSVNMVPTSKQDVRELGSPQEVADALIKRVLAPPSQKIKLVEASEHDADGKAYYTFEFTAQAPNFTRHALGAIVIANGKFYTLTTGANERRWEKMKDRLHTVVDSFKIDKL